MSQAEGEQGEKDLKCMAEALGGQVTKDPGEVEKLGSYLKCKGI